MDFLPRICGVLCSAKLSEAWKKAGFPLESPAILWWDGQVLGLKLGNPAPII